MKNNLVIYFTISILFSSCHDNEKKYQIEIQKLENDIKNLESKNIITRTDSLRIFKRVSKDIKYNKTVRVLDSIHKVDSMMYLFLLKEAEERYWDLDSITRNNIGPDDFE